MSTKVIAVIFIVLLGVVVFLVTGGDSATQVHTMPDGTIMKNDDPTMETMPSGSHVMPDGTMMNADGTHTMPDGTRMQNTDPAMGVPAEPAPTPVSVPAPTPKPTPAPAPNQNTNSAPMDHSMMGHSM